MGFRREVCGPDRAMVDGSVVFGDIIGAIVWARAPKVVELFLCGVTRMRVKFHIHQLEAFAGNNIGHNS